MDYLTASVEEIASHFATVSRQRVFQLLKKFSDRGEDEIVEKMHAAKCLVRAKRHDDKHGHRQAASKAGRLWQMIQHRVAKNPAYRGCSIAWASGSDFRAWAVSQIGFLGEGFELDKDVLVKGNRVYGPDTCVFIPQELNVLFSGCYHSERRGKYPIGVSFNKGSGTFVAQMSNRQEAGFDKYLGSFATVEEAFICYKTAKEAKIKALANKWKDHIDPKAYEALMARTVEWDD